MFIAQEKEAPYAVRVYVCTDEYMNEGYDIDFIFPNPTFVDVGAMAIVGLAMIVPNLLAIGSNSFDADLSPFNLSGIDFDDWITRTSTHPGGPGDNLLFHAHCAVSFLLVGLLLHVRPFFRSIRRYVR